MIVCILGTSIIGQGLTALDTAILISIDAVNNSDCI